MNKEDFINWIKENISNDSEVFVSDKKDSYGVFDVKIFDEHHDNCFYDFYLGI
jgi:hypothetical protein